ncbi:MAG: DUF5804 family protein [Methanomicrobiales archaeon]|nr:DUF5804 family protein [Methanomicrobiales archaeon]
MKVLFLPKGNVDLYAILQASETSRNILRFYEPRNLGFGVEITATSLGTALSLVSELRWYVQRYMRKVLFGLKDEVYGTLDLAREIYDRDIPLSEDWPYRDVYMIRKGRLAAILELPKDAEKTSFITSGDLDDLLLEVWHLGPDQGDEETGSYSEEPPSDEEH